jgi:hypothetical protein
MCWIEYQKGNILYGLMPVLIGSIAFLVNEIAIRWYFSLIRRWKAKIFFRTTLLYMGSKSVKKMALNTYQNSGIVSRVWIPYLIFLMINLILVLLGVGGILGALIIDILIGIYWYQQKCQQQSIIEGLERIVEGDSNYQIDTSKLQGQNLRLARAANSLGAGIRKAVETSMKDEKLKTDLKRIPANTQDAATYCGQTIIADMNALRADADILEQLTDKSCWPYPTYSDLLFY